MKLTQRRTHYFPLLLESYCELHFQVGKDPLDGYPPMTYRPVEGLLLCIDLGDER